MQNTFIRITDTEVILDRNQTMTALIVVGAVILFVILITLYFRTRKKNFIKTIPTNLKGGK